MRRAVAAWWRRFVERHIVADYPWPEDGYPPSTADEVDEVE